ncbi:hypothetical protein D1007_19979 [Hordeum vulgare]|nr:hypothetical protein D1007_19979 [Hordeum vulgare]
MGNKGSSSVSNTGEEGWEWEATTASKFVLKVPTDCRCLGCTGKLRAAVAELALAPGVLELAPALASLEVGVLAVKD